MTANKQQCISITQATVYISNSVKREFAEMTSGTRAKKKKKIPNNIARISVRLFFCVIGLEKATTQIEQAPLRRAPVMQIQ